MPRKVESQSDQFPQSDDDYDRMLYGDFPPGRKVRHRTLGHEGWVVQTGGGRDGDRTEVRWPHMDNQAIWAKNDDLEPLE